jgi:hypothetical protein
MTHEPAHARLSPSGSKKWMACAGSITLEAPFPDNPSEHAERGTACHIVAAECLRSTELVPSDWLMDRVKVSNPGEADRWVEFTEDLCEMTTGYVNEIKTLSAGCELFVEKKVKYLNDEFGTIDAHWLRPLISPMQLGSNQTAQIFEIVICDLKTGYKYVGTDSPQLKCYALGVLSLYDLSHDIVQVRLMIYQPRHGGMREEVITITELREFEEKLKFAALVVDEAADRYAPMYAAGEGGRWMELYLNPNPNEEECAFCKALPTCGAARAKFEATVGASFDVIDENAQPAQQLAVTLEQADGLGADVDEYLGKMMAITGFLEDWIKAVRAECERHLMLGQPVAGYGLELGRQGNRAWVDETEVEQMIRKQFRIKIDDAYNMKLKSPTQIEELAKRRKPTKKNPNPAEPVLTEIQWKKLQAKIRRSDAVPSVKPIGQIKTPYSVTKADEDAFEVIEEKPTLQLPHDEEPPLW